MHAEPLESLLLRFRFGLNRVDALTRVGRRLMGLDKRKIDVGAWLDPGDRDFFESVKALTDSGLDVSAAAKWFADNREGPDEEKEMPRFGAFGRLVEGDEVRRALDGLFEVADGADVRVGGGHTRTAEYCGRGWPGARRLARVGRLKNEGGMWRWLIGIVVVLALIGAGALMAAPAVLESQLNRVEPHAPYEIGARTHALHATLDMADLHADTLLWGRDVLERATRGHVDVPRLQEGRFALQVFSTVTKSPEGQNYERTAGDTDRITLLAQLSLWPRRTWDSLLERALYQAERLNAAAARDPRALTVVRTRGDLAALMARRANGETVVGGLLATEGAHPLEGELANLRKLYDAGFRMIGLQHFFDNELGGSMHGVSKGGLTPFGVQAVRAIEEMGLIIDAAHSSERVIDDVLQIATRPIVVSHTGVRGACKSARNLSDAQARAIAAKGGLIGIGFWPGAVCDATPEGVVKSLRYAVALVGVDHVALGSDYDGTTTVRFDASESAALVEAMLAAGFSEAEVRKIAGENVLRLLDALLPD